jgi:hypothetical protein
VMLYPYCVGVVKVAFPILNTTTSQQRQVN